MVVLEKEQVKRGADNVGLESRQQQNQQAVLM